MRKDRAQALAPNRAACFIAAVLFAATARAQDVRVYGPGGVSCAVYSAARGRPDAPLEAALGFWFSGVISGHNLYSIGPTYETNSALDFPAIFARIDKFCKEHPNAFVVSGIVDFIDEKVNHQ